MGAEGVDCCHADQPEGEEGSEWLSPSEAGGKKGLLIPTILPKIPFGSDPNFDKLELKLFCVVSVKRNRKSDGVK